MKVSLGGKNVYTGTHPCIHRFNIFSNIYISFLLICVSGQDSKSNLLNGSNQLQMDTQEQKRKVEVGNLTGVV